MTAIKRQRLRPGELDALVLAYMGKNGADGPLTASPSPRASTAPPAQWPTAFAG